MWRKLSITLAVIALASVSVVTLYAPDSPQITEDAFPDRIGSGIALPDSHLAIEQRVTEYWEDEYTPKTTSLLFTNGELAVDHHRPNGSIERRELFYVAKPDGTRQLKVQAEIAQDGVTYVSDASFYPDGAKQRSGLLRADGKYEILNYFEDGVHVHTNQVVGAKGEALLETVLRLDGSVEQRAQLVGHTYEVTSFAPDGRALKMVGTTLWSTREVTYFPDGLTVKTDFLMEAHKTTAKYFSMDGKPTQVREFTNQRMISTIYSDGLPNYKQIWELENTDATKPEDVRIYRLTAASVFDVKGRVSWRVVISGKSGYPNFIESGKNALEDDPLAQVTWKWFDDEGYLMQILIRQGEYGREVLRQDFEKGPREEIPVFLKLEIPYEVPPIPVPPREPPMYR